MQTRAVMSMSDVYTQLSTWCIRAKGGKKYNLYDSMCAAMHFPFCLWDQEEEIQIKNLFLRRVVISPTTGLPKLKKSFPRPVQVDFSAAFDLVNYNALIFKL